MERVLLLNASYEPIRIVSLFRAVCLVLDEKADIIEAQEGAISSPSVTIDKPSVIRLRAYVKIPYGKKKLPVTRHTVLARDAYKCGYCGKKANTVDHIFPKALGGQNVWKNVTAACAKCNNKKADKTLKDLGWKQLNKIYEPTSQMWLVVGVLEEEAWSGYVQAGLNEVATT